MRFSSGLIAALRKPRPRSAVTRGDLVTAMQLRGNELTGHRLPQNCVDDVFPVERPRSVPGGLLAEVVLRGVELERQHVVGPSGERRAASRTSRSE